MLSRLFRRVSANIAADRQFAGPSGTRLYAVGDVHGRLDLLDDLLGRVRADLRARPVETGALVFLGDLIDRGPDSAGVLGRLCALDDFPAKTLFLLGNHEEMLLRALSGEPGVIYNWLDFGGDACVESYGLPAAGLKAMDEARAAEALKEAIPATHRSFLDSFGDTFAFGDYLLVHAGIRPGVAIADQVPHDLRWIRRPFLTDAHDHGVMVIHGHTISDGVDLRPNRVGIDTGAYQTGVLTAAVVEGGELRFIQTGGAD